MSIVRLVRSAHLALILAVILGATAGRPALAQQSAPPAAASADEPTTLPRCGDTRVGTQPPAISSIPGPDASQGVREAPSGGLSAEQQSNSAQGTSTGELPESSAEFGGGTGPVPCAESPDSP